MPGAAVRGGGVYAAALREALRVAVEVGEGFGVVGDHGVEVESLRVGEVGVGDRNGDRGPVGAEPAAEAIGVVARAEVVVAGFRIAFLALEFVILRKNANVGALAAVRIEIRVVADNASSNRPSN